MIVIQEKISFIRSIIGSESKLMLDCNQGFGDGLDKLHLTELKEFNPVWIEEPTARDDVQGHIKISNALKNLIFKLLSGEQSPFTCYF